MTTVINNPREGDSSLGMIIGVIVGIILVLIFFVYGLPAMRGTKPPENGSLDVKVQLPAGDNSNPSGSTQPQGTGSSY